MTEQTTNINSIDAWLMAIRPHTLPAAAAPVLVGTSLAYFQDVFSVLPALAALLGALFIQIGTNLANDYFDAEKGVDTDDRTGFTRVTRSGLIAPESVWRGMVFFFFLAFCCGIYLACVSGWPVIVIGITGIFFGITYSGGPVPYGSYALGDLMVFLYFGLIAVWGTYFVQLADVSAPVFPVILPEQSVPATVVLAAIPSACLSTAILVVNNLRDLDTDRRAGKYTMAVMLGPVGSRIEYSVLVGTSLVVPGGLPLVFDQVGGWTALPLVLFPFAGVLVYNIWTIEEGEAFNRLLSRTGKLLILHAILFSLGFLL